MSLVAIHWVLWVVIAACKPQSASDIYYFASFYEEDSTPSYLQMEIIDKGNERTEKIVIFDQSKRIEDEDLNRFLVSDEGLRKKIGNEYKSFLSIRSTDCVEFDLGDQQANELFGTVICYLGREDVVINESKIVKDVYKFRKLLGNPGGVESIMYLDENFVLLKEVYVSGYTAAYKIVRLDSALKL